MIERASVAFQDVKFAGKPGAFAGYGAVFGNEDAYGDVIRPGAFKTSLRDWQSKGKLPPMLLQHGGGPFGGDAMDAVPIGKWTEMTEDEKGLYVEGYLFAMNTPDQQRLYEAMKAGEMSGMSIGYVARKSKMGTTASDPRRWLDEVDLIELSVVTFPANTEARVDGVKSIDQLSRRELERLLRKGLTQSQATAVAAKLRGATGEPAVADVVQAAKALNDKIRKLTERK